MNIEEHGGIVSFDEEWAQARSAAAARQQAVAETRLNSVPVERSGGGGAADYKVTSPDLKAIGNEAQELFHWFERDAFHAGAKTDVAAKSLDADGFQTGSALWTVWDTWCSQAETLLSACAHIHNHLEDTVITHANHEEILATNFSISLIDKHFN
ncbi:hypothetical protein Q5762_13370 [Streptomyces sp. P9(2023)]|uniref:hypothetical protein n=1 Tax=Streptomyces sp. P9(2023) TaxID=3064394 RepID=UPI0028F41FA2|nr:hypothetical protein [Streptomyces sp. P9(2023)]MDT9689311.1 hypothetical protein [Streptomyces sp. P9(2023)]